MPTHRQALALLLAVLASALACGRGEEPQPPSDPPSWWECAGNADCAAGELCSGAHACGAPALVLLGERGPVYVNDTAFFTYGLELATGVFSPADLPDASGATVELVAGDGAVLSSCDLRGWCWADAGAWAEATYGIRARAAFPGRVFEPDGVLESAPMELVVDHTAPTFVVSPPAGPVDFATMSEVVVLTFSEPLDLDARLPRHVVAVSTKPVGTLAVERTLSDDGLTATVRFSAPLAAYDEVTLHLSRFSDRAGISMPDAQVTWTNAGTTP